MKKCPKCGATEFYVTAHVTQDWKVDSQGEFLVCLEPCVEVVHRPDNDDLWGCAECGYEDSGNIFESEEEKI